MYEKCARKTLMKLTVDGNLKFFRESFSHLVVFEHKKPCYICRTSKDLEILFLDSVVEIVVLATPSVKAVGKPVDLLELQQFKKKFKMNIYQNLCAEFLHRYHLCMYFLRIFKH